MPITISGSTGIAGVDGSASTPAVQGTDTNTGTFFPAADIVAVATGGTERMRVSAAGNVGIGTSSPGSNLDVVGTSAVTSSTTTPVFYAASSQAAGFAPPNIQMRRMGASGGVTPDNQTIGQIRFDGISLGAAYDNMAFITVEGGVNVSGGIPCYMSFGTASSGSNAVERMRIDSSGNLLFNSGYGSVATAYGCRAWVYFNGTGTVAINSSGNVSSITDNGTGRYTVNFTTALPDTNYSVAGFASNNDNNANESFVVSAGSTSTYTTSAVSIWTVENTTSATIDGDSPRISVVIFR